MPGAVYARALRRRVTPAPAAALSVGYFSRTVCEQNV